MIYENLRDKSRVITIVRKVTCKVGKGKFIIVEDNESVGKYLLHLKQLDLKSAHINPWDVMNKSYYVKGIRDELGIITHIN